jgi:hypothetical protein
MEEILSPVEAWIDFYAWIKSSEKWNQISRADKQYLDKTNRAVLSGNAGQSRIKKALELHAPGLYAFVELSGFRRC